ncbi:Hypothetical protein, putative [Bodo saltans]|uniref:Uncharacterized protein n=1 Tax=Bodo saltans TaxID=75058 RepID=A0A0S4JLE6_BODSA|nr:Hypothetical protein, putative [Bodo saltans]|eukprot:CUG90218.1 Hypothetical protein, putative [Bodo saltans]
MLLNFLMPYDILNTLSVRITSNKATKNDSLSSGTCRGFYLRVQDKTPPCVEWTSGTCSGCIFLSVPSDM